MEAASHLQFRSTSAQITHRPHPSIFGLLNLPFGITTGYIVVVIPYLATHAGLSVGTAASMVAVGIAPKALKVIWAPLADMGLTLKTWYGIGASVSGLVLIASSFIPFSHATVPLIAAAFFTAEFGSSLLAPALGALMADAMPDQVKGRAAGWYQLGGKVGRGIGGGGGLWLAVNGAGPHTATAVLGVVCVSCIAGLNFLDEPQRRLAEKAVQRFVEIGRELWRLGRSREGLLVALLAVAPIGISGADNFFSGIAGEWRVPVGTVALVTGFAGSLFGMAGCLIAGWWADRGDRRLVYLATGLLVAAASAALAIAPHVPGVFIAGTMTQRIFLGMSDAALSALTLSVIGRSAAATKFTVLAALGNIPEVYMTSVSGWVHDNWSTATMLLVESGIALVCLGGAALWLKRYNRADTSLARPSAGGDAV